MVDEEVGATPFVLLEHLKRQRYKLAVVAKIVEHLRIDLRLDFHGTQEECCQQHRYGS